jgi:hypothetical protein
MRAHLPLRDATDSVSALRLAVIAEIEADGTAHVHGPGGTRRRCAILEGGGPEMVPGDEVLVWEEPAGERLVILGRIRDRLPDASMDGRVDDASAAEGLAAPDHLVLEARESLSIRVGDGSITVRADGRILIKGKDLVSHATRLNRIKGGAVQIN